MINNYLLIISCFYSKILENLFFYKNISNKMTQMINRARNSTFKIIYEKNAYASTCNNFQIAIVKTALNKRIPNCQKNVYTEKIEELCFNTITLK